FGRNCFLFEGELEEQSHTVKETCHHRRCAAVSHWSKCCIAKTRFVLFQISLQVIKPRSQPLDEASESTGVQAGASVSLCLLQFLKVQIVRTEFEDKNPRSKRLSGGYLLAGTHDYS